MTQQSISLPKLHHHFWSKSKQAARWKPINTPANANLVESTERLPMLQGINITLQTSNEANDKFSFSYAILLIRVFQYYHQSRNNSSFVYEAVVKRRLIDWFVSVIDVKENLIYMPKDWILIPGFNSVETGAMYSLLKQQC